MAEQRIDPVLLEIVWNRLVSVVTEQAKSIIRTSFSPLVREAGDVATAVFDSEGRMIAHGVTGTPGHIFPMSATMEHFLSRFPAETLKPGDVLITNDPWAGSGHLFDVIIATPVFQKGKLVAHMACTAHQVDIGGLGYGTRASDIYEEGLFIPPVRFARKGRFEEAVIDFIRANIREPDVVVGDLQAMTAANDNAAKSVCVLMEEYKIEDLDAFAAAVFQMSEKATREAIRKIPNGVYRAEISLDGDDAPVKVVSSVEVSDEEITVDFAGSSPQSPRGINVCLNYTSGFALFAVWCALHRDIPSNFGSLKPIGVRAPVGTIVSARFPAPVSSRHVIGQMVPGVVLKALSLVLPEQVIAEGAGSIWAMAVQGTRPDGRPYMMALFQSGGMGARPFADGISAMQYPTGTSCVPIEVVESVSPVRYLKKALRADSGGAGRYRGGLGQEVEMEINPGDGTCDIAVLGDRVLFQPSGLFEGDDGAAGSIEFEGKSVPGSKLQQRISKATVVKLRVPGAGGYGSPGDRDPQLVRRDIEFGYISYDHAKKHYPHALK